MVSKRVRRSWPQKSRRQKVPAVLGLRQKGILLSVSFALMTLLNASDVLAQASDPKIAPSTVRFSSNAKQFKLIEQKNRDGKVIRETLIGEDFLQTSADREADGHIDYWELNRANSMLHLSSPANGHFSKMEYEKKYPQGILHLDFLRNGKGTFQLISSNARPYTRLRKADSSYEDLVAGCRVGEVHLQETAVDLLASISNTEQDSTLRKTLAAEAMTPECRKGEFAQNQSKIIDGIMRVVKSDNKETIGKEASKKPTTKGTYLQCLRYYELDTHANRITSAFSSYSSAMKQDVFRWRIICDANSKDAGAFAQIPNAPPVIGLGPAARQTKAGGDLVNGYAATFFHEMLHYSLIENEGIASTIEQCCSQVGGENSPACKKVESIVRIQKRAQVFENEIAKQFHGNYTAYRDSLRKEFGAKADKEIARFFTAAATEYEKVKSECQISDGTELTGSCRDKFNERLKAAINKEFGDGDNGACQKAALDKSNAQAYCATLKQIVYEKFQIPNDGLEGKNYCKKNGLEVWMRWLIRGIQANAYADGAPSSSDQTQILCNFKDSNPATTPLHFDESSSDLANLGNYAPNVPPITLPPNTPIIGQKTNYIEPIAQKQDTFFQTGADAVPNDSGPSQNFGKPAAKPNQGPEAISYSDQPTQRETQILTSLQHQQDTDTHLTQIADRIAQQTFPSAEAKQVTDVGSNSAAEMKNNSAPAANLLSYLRPATNEANANSIPASPTNLASYPSVPDPLSPSRSIASLPPPALITASSVSGGSAVGGSGIASGIGSVSNANNGATPPQYIPVYQYRYGGGRKFYQVGGLGDPQSGAAGTKNENGTSKSKTRSELEARERKNILSFLQGPYKGVRPELDNGKFVSELARYAIQVIDDKGKAYGSGLPSSKLTYDERLGRLILTSTRALEANQ